MIAQEAKLANKHRIAAILAAGGAGSRFANEPGAAPKQFVHLMGRPMYVWSLLRLAANDQIESLVVVAPEAHLALVHEHVEYWVSEPELRQKVRITAGGATRQESVYKGIQLLELDSRPPDILLIHDGARPLLAKELLSDVINTSIKYGACTPGVGVTDTIKRVQADCIVETLDRSELYAVQTPQAARFTDLANAHRKAVTEGWSVTDDASILERDGHKVVIVPSSPYNLKVTQPLDLVLCEALAQTLLKS